MTSSTPRAAKLSLAALAILLGLMSANAALAAPKTKALTRAQIAACPDFAGYDWRKFSKLKALDATLLAQGDDEFHSQIRGGYPIPDLSAADIALSIAVGPGEGQQDPTSTSSFVWREGGQWRVDRVDHSSVWAMSPPDPADNAVTDRASREAQQRQHAFGPIDAKATQALEVMLADPCLDYQPDHPPSQIPTKDNPGAPCWGGTGGTLVIRRRDQVRVIADYCGRWVAGRLMHDVIYAHVDTAHYVREAVRARDPSLVERITSLRAGKSRVVDVMVVCGTFQPKPGSQGSRLIYTFQPAQPKAIEQVEIEGLGAEMGVFSERWRAVGCDAAA